MNDDSTKAMESTGGTNMINQSSGGGLGATSSSAPSIPQKPEPISKDTEPNSSNNKQ